jgi:hypothetical protein
VDLATSKDTPPTVAVAACNSILNHAARNFHWDVYEARLSKLEAFADQRGKDKDAYNRQLLEEAIGRSRKD